MKRSASRPIALLASLAVVTVVTTASSEVGHNTTVLNPNQASVEELTKLPHVTAAIAKQLHEATPFLTMTEVDTLLRKTLSDKERAELYEGLFLPINLNTAERDEIMLVPGIGKKMAHEFEEYRPYEGMARFRREMGKYVDDDEVARLEQYVFVPIDLNTASDEDILGIPGLGKRMLHEFKEYRPYKSMAQFRREIGKYVDDEELARLERYVTVGETPGAK